MGADAVKSAIIAAALLMLAAPGTSFGQYMYLDANGDAVHDSTDALNGIDVPTTVRIYLVTNRTIAGDSVACDHGAGSLSATSYVINLRALSGTVTFSGFANNISSWTVPFGERNAGDGGYENGFGGTPATALGPGGPFLLGTVVITARSGMPGIEICDRIANSPEETSFGSQCEGLNLDNTYKLGVDWFEALGLPVGVVGTPALLVAAPPSVVGAEDSALAFSATATGAEGSSVPSLEATGYPSFLTFSSAASGTSEATGTLLGIPGPTDSGTWQIGWIARDQATGAADSVTTILQVEDTNLPASANLPDSLIAKSDSPAELSVQFVDPNNDPIEEVTVGPMPPGSYFEPRTDGSGRGVIVWVPPPGLVGKFPITLRAKSRGGVGAVTTMLEAVAAQGPPKPFVSPALRRLVSRDPRSNYLVETRHGGVVGANILASCGSSTEALRALGCDTGIWRDSLCTLWCPIDSLTSLFGAPGLRILADPGVCHTTLDSVALATHADGIRSGFPPPYSGAQGAPVIVGIVDSGIDATLNDFFRPFDQGVASRIHRIWDQTAGPFFGQPAPGPWNYGSEYTRQQITNAGPEGPIGERDFTGHGTRVAGIAAGNGRGGTACMDVGTFVGLAPEADLVVVKSGPNVLNIIDAIDYIFSKADSLGRPAVVNISVGSHVGAHDGGSAFDTGVSERAGPGRIIVAAAGNDGVAYNGIHASASPRFAGLTEVLAFDVLPYNVGVDNKLVVSGWLPLVGGFPADSFELSVKTPRGVTVGPVTIGYSDNAYTIDGFVNICLGGSCSTDIGNSIHSYELRIEISDSPAPRDGRWEVWVKALRNWSAYPTDFYISYGTFSAGWVQGESSDRVVSSPATGDSVIAVGAFMSKDCWKVSSTMMQCEQHGFAQGSTIGVLADFSSRGPRRDGVLKPDISAPGAMVASVRSRYASFSPQYIAYGGGHVIGAGTSLAAPVVTGTAALLLGQPDSSWSTAGPTRVRARIAGTARADQFTGAVPNYAWGYGKLDVASALAPVQRLRIFHPRRDQIVGPSPDSVTFTLTGAQADSVVFYLAADSCLSYGHRVGKATNVAPNSPRAMAFFAPETVASPHASLRGFAFASDSVVAATSEGFFIFTSPTAVGTETSAVPRALSIEQVHPNPFNPTATIRFGVDRTGRVALRVFSATGRLVKTIADGYFPPGSYDVTWDGNDLYGRPQASGVYFVEVSSQNQRRSRKVSLLR